MKVFPRPRPKSLILSASLEKEVDVFLMITDLDGFIHATPETYINVYDADGNQSQVSKKSLSDFQIHSVSK